MMHFKSTASLFVTCEIMLWCNLFISFHVIKDATAYRLTIFF